jgi:predicted nucleotidyltransferase
MFENTRVHVFLEQFRLWAQSRPDILGVALVGSHARNEATADSDVDLIVVAAQPAKYLQDAQWADNFGTVTRKQIENYGKVTSLRVWYSEGLEVEYGFTDETWCASPVDQGTREVIAKGMVILEDRDSIFSRIGQSDPAL